MNVFKKGLLKGRRNQGAENVRGNITYLQGKRNFGDGDGGDVEGWGSFEGKYGGICLLGSGHVCVRQGQRKKGRDGCRSYGDLGNGGAGKGIRYHISVAGQMLKGCIEFGKKGKMPLPG
jgi:hypothetical protein